MSRYKFIIVSNRLPVSVSKSESGQITLSPSAGGLATAMSSLEGDTAEHLWIGWPGIAADDLTPQDRATITRKLAQHGCYPVFLTQAEVNLFYEGYSNETIWPLFHYFKRIAQFESEYWDAYQVVNKKFQQATARKADEQAAIWVHDYHLMLLPQLLRDRLPRCSIGFFLHIPFPSFELFRLLPNRREILEGLLGADLIGFHIYDYVRHFTSSVLRTLGYKIDNGSIILPDRVVKADAFPIGIDYAKFKAAVDSPEVIAEIQTLQTHYWGQKVILSVDRLDYSKGIGERLEAFEQFLAENPRWHKKVTLVVIAVPSRTEVDAYKELREDIERTVSRINGAYASVDWTPISYQFRNLPFEELVALYAHAAVALVTPLRDGMNLVAKEYVACKQKTAGVLVLSEFTGAVDELPEALVINPNDRAAMVQALKTALTMPLREQRERLHSMQGRLANYTVQRWARDFIEQLATAKHLQMQHGSKLLTPQKQQIIMGAYHAARKRAVILDYDGTLRPFVSSPQAARAAPSGVLKRLLKQFATQPATDLFIVSGRSREALETWFGDLPATLVAEHGFWVRDRTGWSQEENNFKSYKSSVMALLEQYAERTPGVTIEAKNFSLVWHYRNVPPELAYARNTSLKHDLADLLKDTDIGIFQGHKIIEIKPRGITKGVLVDELLVGKTYDFILCAGDDYTDEDMFRSLPESAYTIKVGQGDTSARYQTTSPEKLIQFLEQLL